MTPSPSPRDRKKVETEGETIFDANGFKREKTKEVHNVQGESSVLKLFSKLFFWGENEKIDKTLRKFEAKMPTTASWLASIAMFLLGISARGEWVIFAVYFWKYLQTGGSDTYVEESHEMIDSFQDWIQLRFNNYFGVLIPSTIVSYAMYFGLGGFLHWYYYVRQRETPETWKCQPKKWLSPELERHEIMVGCISLVFGSAISAGFSTYIINGGTWTKVYFDFTEYGYLWLILQVPAVFIYQDYITYWMHRMYHTPWLYKNFHKLHHTYKQPTAFSVTAIHPVEFIHMQFMLMTATFFIPVHWLNLSIVMMYTYYHGIIDHSGIDFKRKWWQPWQPDCIFHDNHHQYFHVNFGFNIEFWDRLHGTYRRKDRIYREDIFYGSGKPIDEATSGELQEELEERESENPLAHRDDINLPKLSPRKR